jgi:hypothetical protein
MLFHIIPYQLQSPQTFISFLRHWTRPPIQISDQSCRTASSHRRSCTSQNEAGPPDKFITEGGRLKLVFLVPRPLFVVIHGVMNRFFILVERKARGCRGPSFIKRTLQGNVGKEDWALKDVAVSLFSFLSFVSDSHELISRTISWSCPSSPSRQS